MARGATKSEPVEGEAVVGGGGLADQIVEYAAADGSKLFVTPDGTPFTDRGTAESFMKENQADIIVDQFMATVDSNPAAFFGNKKGALPESERALAALKTRLRNNALKVVQWYLSQC